MLRFLQSLGGEGRGSLDGSKIFRLTDERAAHLVFTPDENADATIEPEETSSLPGVAGAGTPPWRLASEGWEEIASDTFDDREPAAQVIDGRRLRPRPSMQRPFVAPRSAAEPTLARLWADALGLDGSASTTTSSSSEGTLSSRRCVNRGCAGARRRARRCVTVRGAHVVADLAERSGHRRGRRRPAAGHAVPREASRRGCRSRSPSSGCGSSTSSSRAAASTTCGWRSACTGRSTSGRWRRAREDRAPPRGRCAPVSDRRRQPVQSIRDADFALPVRDPISARCRPAAGGETLAAGRGRPPGRSISSRGPAVPAPACCASATDDHVLCSCSTTSSPTAGPCGVLLRELAALYRAA